MGTIQLPNGGTIQTPQAFDDLPDDEKQKHLPEILDQYEQAMGPIQTAQTPHRDPRNSMIDAARASIFDDLPANLLEGAGAAVRTAQDNLPGSHSNLGDAIVDTLENGANKFRGWSKDAYQRPDDLAPSATGAILSGHPIQGIRKLAYEAAEGAGSALPALAAAGLTGGLSVPAALGATALQAAGQQEASHGSGTGLTGADMLDVLGQTALGRIPGIGPRAEAARQLLGNAGQQLTDHVNGTDAQQSSADHADSLGDSLLTGLVTGGAAKHVVAPVGRAVQAGAADMSDRATGAKNGFGDAVSRIVDTRKAENLWDAAHADETKKVMQGSKDITPSDAMDVARDNLQDRGMNAPAPMSTDDRRTVAHLDYVNNVLQARKNNLGLSKAGDAPLAKAILDQSKEDAGRYVDALSKAGPEFGGTDKPTTQLMKQLVTHAATHNHDNLVNSTGDFLVTPEDTVRGLNIPEKEKRTFLRHLDTIRMSAYNGLERENGSLGQKIGTEIAGMVPSAVMGGLGYSFGGPLGAMAGSLAGMPLKAAGRGIGRRIESALGVGGMPAMKGADAKVRYATKRGYEPGAPLRDIQTATQDAMKRAGQRRDYYEALQAAQKATAAHSKHGGSNTPNMSGMAYKGDPLSPRGPNWRPNEAFVSPADRMGPNPVTKGPEPSYPRQGQPEDFDTDLDIVKRQAARIKGATARRDDDGKIRVKVPARFQLIKPEKPQKATRTYTARSAPAQMPTGPSDALEDIRHRSRYTDAMREADTILAETLSAPSVKEKDAPILQAVRGVKHVDDKRAILDKFIAANPDRSEGLSADTARMDMIGTDKSDYKLSDKKLSDLMARLGLKK